MLRPNYNSKSKRIGFTLIELLVVISIIALLISILMPSLSRARDQAKKVHCVARLHDFGTSIAIYQNDFSDLLPPPRWFPDTNEFVQRDDYREDPDRPVEYGWTEILFSYVYKEKVQLSQSYPVQRNVNNDKFEEYFICKAVGDVGINSGHYRVYLPSWAAGSYSLEPGGVYGDTTRANPFRGTNRDSIRPKMPLIGDANDLSERGDGLGDDDCSYIDAGEANFVGNHGNRSGNRFSDRHYGGTNFLFQDLHAEWSTGLRKDLARDYDLNGVVDIPIQP